MSIDPERTPVLVGSGQINDRPDDPVAGLDSLELMEAALRRADEDAGGGWLARTDWLGVVDPFTFRELNPVADRLIDAIGATGATARQTDGPNGDSPILLLNEAANLIGEGKIAVAAVTGGEALRTAMARAKAAAGSGDAPSNPMRAAAAKRKPGWRQSYGLATPVDVYPLYENATRAAWGQSLAEGQAESAAIWHRMSEVAAGNEHAWLREPVSAERIATPGEGNRPLAFPYTKLMVANSSVNQGAAFIVTSLAAARAAGIAEDQLIFVGEGAAARESDDFLKRPGYAASASMAASLEGALERNGLDITDIDHAELYSCFPCVPKMARRIVDWPVDRPATVFGGLTFGGGPIGNYMSHAVGSMIDALRGDTNGSATGLLFANGGFATYNHTIPVSREPFERARFPHDFDCNAKADAAREDTPDLVHDYEGAATIETYTMFYDRGGAATNGVIVARTDEGSRTLAAIPPSATDLIALLTDGAHEPVGTTGTVVRGANDLQEWRSS